MARVFKRKDRLSAMSEINITSLLDLVFCLLIIFMITTPLLEQTIPVNLPKEPRSPAADRNPKLQYVTVSFNADGQYYYDKTPVTLDELRQKLKDLAALPDPPAISLRGDAKAYYQTDMDVMDALQKAGLSKIYFDNQVQ
jgi:biopolymer transport protein ExbD